MKEQGSRLPEGALNRHQRQVNVPPMDRGNFSDTKIPRALGRAVMKQGRPPNLAGRVSNKSSLLAWISQLIKDREKTESMKEEKTFASCAM